MDSIHNIKSAHLAVVAKGLLLNSWIQIAYMIENIGIPINKRIPIHPMMAKDVGAPAKKSAPNGDRW